MDKQTVMVAMSNQKGGVGKSTLTVMLAGYLHYVENKNVLVVDCDHPQHSLSAMRERDIRTVGKNERYKQMIVSQFERLEKKAFPIINSTPDQAREAAEDFIRSGDIHYDIVFIDLPGTMETQGVFRAIVNMDYVLTPIIADRMVMHSSLSFSTAVLDYIKGRKDIPLKNIYFFWNRVDKRVSTDIYDAYDKIMRQLGLHVLETVLPESRRFDKELSLTGKPFFRCTLLPPAPMMIKGSNIDLLAREVMAILNL